MLLRYGLTIQLAIVPWQKFRCWCAPVGYRVPASIASILRHHYGRLSWKLVVEKVSTRPQGNMVFRKRLCEIGWKDWIFKASSVHHTYAVQPPDQLNIHPMPHQIFQCQFLLQLRPRMTVLTTLNLMNCVLWTKCVCKLMKIDKPKANFTCLSHFDACDKTWWTMAMHLWFNVNQTVWRRQVLRTSTLQGYGRALKAGYENNFILFHNSCVCGKVIKYDRKIVFVTFFVFLSVIHVSCRVVTQHVSGYLSTLT